MDPKEMVEELEECLETEEHRFTSWEIDFIESMRERIDDDLEFTEAQIEKIEEIYENYLG